MKVLIFILMLCLAMPACKDEAPMAVQPTKEELTIQNAYIVRDAAEAHGVTNGRYPVIIEELMPFLPNGDLLVNVFTSNYSEPVYGAAVWTGQVGYTAAYDSTSWASGYVIEAYGENDIILTIRKPTN